MCLSVNVSVSDGGAKFNNLKLFCEFYDYCEVSRFSIGMHDMATIRKHFGSSIFAICSPRMSSVSNSAPSHERLDQLQEEIENIRTKANELVRYIAPLSALSEEVEDACKNANGKLQRIAYLSAWLAQSSVTTSSMSCVGNNGPSGKQLDQLQEEIHKNVTDLLLYIAPCVSFLSEERSQNARNIASGLVQLVQHWCSSWPCT